ncbi:MAG: hypothetical protein ACI84K_001595 [Pseudohongiellaceae bacterium]|jgi:hypothetical protein
MRSHISEALQYDFSYNTTLRLKSRILKYLNAFYYITITSTDALATAPLVIIGQLLRYIHDCFGQALINTIAEF